MNSTRFIENEEKFLEYAWTVFEQHFNDKDSFIQQYRNIPDLERNKFLKIASYYLFFVCEGTVTSPNYETADLAFVDQTYKYVAIISFIEALCAGNDYIDFYQWLMHNRRNALPICNTHDLQSLHNEYLDGYGSTSNVVKFFRSLDDRVIQYICKSIVILKNNGTGEYDEVIVKIEYLVRLLYQIRSDFVHNGELVLEFETGSVPSFRKNDLFVCELDLDGLKRIFEAGLLRHFGIVPDRPRI